MLKINGKTVGEVATIKKQYAEHLKTKPVTALATTQKKDKEGVWTGQPSVSEIVHPGVFVSNGMSITVEGGRTINLGNFESARVGVSLTIPCDPQNLSEAWEWGSSWISGKIEEAIKAATG